MPEFFVSYTSSDEDWAEWIAWTLEETNSKVILQKWDFLAGSNFVLEMQKAASEAKRTIAVLSSNYIENSRFGSAEWAAAFVSDPDGVKRSLIPVRVRPCEISGLLTGIVYIDLIGRDEGTAKRLIDGLMDKRRKPAKSPMFPGQQTTTTPTHNFPGTEQASTSPKISPRFMPRIQGAVTDIERRRFIKDAFVFIQHYFNTALTELSRLNQNVEFDLTSVDASKFTAEIFVNGKCRTRCKIWIGGITGADDIAYAEGFSSLSSNTLNESMTLVDRHGNLVLSATMAAFAGPTNNGLDLHNLTTENAAEYLWRRFSWNLEN